MCKCHHILWVMLLSTFWGVKSELSDTASLLELWPGVSQWEVTREMSSHSLLFPSLILSTSSHEQIRSKFWAKHNSSSLFFNKNNPSSQQHLPNHIKELAGPLSRNKFVGMTHKHKSLGRYSTLPWQSNSLGFCSGTFTPKVFNCMA